MFTMNLDGDLAMVARRHEALRQLAEPFPLRLSLDPIRTRLAVGLVWAGTQIKECQPGPIPEARAQTT